MSFLSRRRYLVLVAGILALWVALATWLVPHLIEAGYNERSLTIINDVFDGRDVHPLAFYLDDWRSIARTTTVLLVVALLVSYAVVRFPGPWRRIARVVFGGTPDLGPGVLVWFGLLAGFASGTGEATARLIRQLVTKQAGLGFYVEELWMFPLSATLAGLLVGGGLATLAMLGGVRVGLRKASLPFIFTVIYAILQSPGIALYPFAEVILSAGLTVVVSRGIVSRSQALERQGKWVRPALVSTLAVLVLLAATIRPPMLERVALSGLPPAEDGRPNVLLIVLDTVRASNLGLYGYERPTTPRLTEWARAGATFERAISTAPWTLPSHATMFTGRYHFETGTSQIQPLDRTFPTLAEVFAEHGYGTAGFVGNTTYTSPMSGLSRGFARYQAQVVDAGTTVGSSWLSRVVFGPLTRATGRFLPTVKEGSHVTDEFLGWLNERDASRPFFAFLNYFDAHSPYTPPEPFASRFGPGPGSGWNAFDRGWYGIRDDPPTGEILSRWINRYDGGIAYVDHQLGIVHDALASRGLLEDTIVAVTSDHGEMWGEHGLLEHSNSLYLPLLHVPLVVVAPGRIERENRIRHTVTLRDLPATLLDLADLSADSPIPGDSMAPLLAGRSQSTSAVLAERDADPRVIDGDGPVPISAGARDTLFSTNLHYVRNGDGEEELYDIDADPDELVDLARSQRFRTELDALREQLQRLGAVRRD